MFMELFPQPRHKHQVYVQFMVWKTKLCHKLDRYRCWTCFQMRKFDNRIFRVFHNGEFHYSFWESENSFTRNRKNPAHLCFVIVLVFITIYCDIVYSFMCVLVAYFPRFVWGVEARQIRGINHDRHIQGIKLSKFV